MTLWTHALTEPAGWRRQLTPENRRRLLFTLLVLAVARALTWVPLPGVDGATYANLIAGENALFAGEAVARVSIAALGVTPYISMWVLTEIFRGRQSNANVEQWRLIGASIFALFQGFGVAVGLEHAQGMVAEPGWMFLLSTTLTLTAGTLLLVWLGTQITRRGVGPGVWVLYAAGFISELPSTAAALLQLGQSGQFSPIFPFAITGIAVAALALIVLVETAERRVALQTVRSDTSERKFSGIRAGGWWGGRAQNQRDTGDQTEIASVSISDRRYEASSMSASSVPALALPIDRATILPAYLAGSLLVLPGTLAATTMADPPLSAWLVIVASALVPGQPVYWLLYAATIIGVTILLTATRRHSDIISDMLRNEQRAIADVPPNQMKRHLDRIFFNLALICAAYLAVLHLLPEILITFFSAPFYIGGSSYLVVALVALHILRGLSHAAPPSDDLMVAAAALSAGASGMRSSS